MVGNATLTDKFYLSERWKKLRKIILVKAKYRDQLLEREGIFEEADTVHHIFPREAYPEYQWERWNLIAINAKTHRKLHNVSGELTNAGRALLEETASKNGVPISKLILIIGLPGSGKTTVASRILDGGVCYDLDHISAALRLRTPHSELHGASRRIANRMFKPFIANARQYSGRVVIVRTAPELEEVSEMDPDEIWICGAKTKKRAADGYNDQKTIDELTERIEEVRMWAEVNEIPLMSYPPHQNGDE